MYCQQNMSHTPAPSCTKSHNITTSTIFDDARRWFVLPTMPPSTTIWWAGSVPLPPAAPCHCIISSTPTHLTVHLHHASAFYTGTATNASLSSGVPPPAALAHPTQRRLHLVREALLSLRASGWDLSPAPALRVRTNRRRPTGLVFLGGAFGGEGIVYAHVGLAPCGAGPFLADAAARLAEGRAQLLSLRAACAEARTERVALESALDVVKAMKGHRERERGEDDARGRADILEREEEQRRPVLAMRREVAPAFCGALAEFKETWGGVEGSE